MTVSNAKQFRFLMPDIYDMCGQGGCPFRVDPHGLAELRERGASSTSSVLQTEYADNCTDYQMYDEAAAAYNMAREYGRDDFNVWHSLAMAYQLGGVLDGAIYAHEEALSRETPDEYWWGTCESLGLCLWKSNRRQEALAMFRQAVDRDSENLSVWCMIHAARDILGDIDDKAEAEQKVVALSDLGSRCRMIAQGYESISEMEKAIELYKEATRKDQHPILPWSNLGRCYMSLSQIGEAIHAFEQCLLCDAIPDRANPHPPAWTSLSYLYGVQGEYERSIHAASIALTYWESGTALANEGASHLAMSEMSNAITCLEKARRLRPDRREVYVTLALAYSSIEKTAELDELTMLFRSLA